MVLIDLQSEAVNLLENLRYQLNSLVELSLEEVEIDLVEVEIEKRE